MTFGHFQRLECAGYTHQLCKLQLLISNMPESPSLVRCSGFCSSQLLWHLQSNKGKKMGKKAEFMFQPLELAVHSMATSHRHRHFLYWECRHRNLRGHNLKLENNIGKIGYSLHKGKSMDSHLQCDFMLEQHFQVDVLNAGTCGMNGYLIFGDYDLLMLHCNQSISIKKKKEWKWVFQTVSFTSVTQTYWRSRNNSIFCFSHISYLRCLLSQIMVIYSCLFL